MAKKNVRNSFILQGSILALAGILVRIIGLIYRMPLANILGPEGSGYYSTAYDIYNVLILLSSQSMPLAVSKLVSEKIGKEEHNNAHKIFKGALIYGIIIGIAFGLFAYLGADWLASSVYDSASVARPLKVLAPTLTVACILGVLRGYFQGMGNMVPTAISQIFEQIINALVSVIAAYELTAYGYSVSKMLSEDKATTVASSWGAAGGTLGTLLGAVTALIVLIIIYIRNRSKIQSKIVSCNNKKEDSYTQITKMIIFTITPVLISTTIYNISNLLDNPIFQNIMSIRFGMSEKIRSSYWATYSTQYRTLTTMPIAIAAALSTAIVPTMVRSYSAGDNRQVKEKIEMAIKFSMIIAFPCGIGLSVLGGPINAILFSKLTFRGIIPYMMIFSIFTVVAFSLSTISNAILQGIDKLKVPIRNSAISLVIHLIILPILLMVFRLGIYAVVIGDILFAVIVCLLNAASIRKYTGYQQEYKNTFLKPLLSSVIMGIVCYGAYWIIELMTKSKILSTGVAIVVAVFVYGIMIIKIKAITEEELSGIPKGTTIIKLLKKFHLI